MSWGSCPPSEYVAPRYRKSLVNDAIKVNEIGGLELFDWQKRALEPILAVHPDGRWICSTVGNEVPRQNGKTLGITCARMQFGMLKRWPILGNRGERIIYTSHLQKTSSETFEYMADFFDSCPQIRKRVKAVKSALGREQIIMKNGGRIKFLARSKNGGRGQHGDLLVFDEALEISPEERASFLPVISASPNAQTIYTSTPPTESSNSEIYAAVRRNALSGRTKRTLWFGWSIPELPADDSTPDELLDLAYETNPSMGSLISEENVMSEIEQMDDILSFAIERLGYWIPPKSADDDRAVDARLFAKCRTNLKAPEDSVPIAFGVKFSPDGSEVSVAVCLMCGDRLRVELAADRSTAAGTRWLRDAMCSHPEVLWIVDGKSGAAATVEAVKSELGDNACLAKTGDVIIASSGLVDSMRENAVEVYSTKADRLEESFGLATKRNIGTGGGWGFGGDSCPLEAVALALLAGKRSEEREEDMEVWF